MDLALDAFAQATTAEKKAFGCASPVLIYSSEVASVGGCVSCWSRACRVPVSSGPPSTLFYCRCSPSNVSPPGPL